MELTTLEDPAAICSESDIVDCEWTSFTLNSVPTEGKPANTVTYAGPGGWVAFKSLKTETGGGDEGWVVRWKYRKFIFPVVDIGRMGMFADRTMKRNSPGNHHSGLCAD